MTTQNSFGAVATLTSGGDTIEYFSLPALERAGFPSVNRLPYSMKILLENLLRHEDGRFVQADDVERWRGWDLKGRGGRRKSRLRPRACCCRTSPACPRRRPGGDARRHCALGGDPNKVNPLQPVELVIDHSVQVDYFGRRTRFS